MGFGGVGDPGLEKVLEVAGVEGCGVEGQVSGEGDKSARGMWLGRRMSSSMSVWTADS